MAKYSTPLYHVFQRELLSTASTDITIQVTRGHIFSCVQPFYEQAVSDLDRSTHRSLWVQVAHNSFIEGSHMTKNTLNSVD